jgi:hypothetical protein
LPSNVRVWDPVINQLHWHIFFFFLHPRIDSYGVLRVDCGRPLVLYGKGLLPHPSLRIGQIA